MASTIKSKPVYASLCADAQGRYHLLLGAAEGAACLRRVLRELNELGDAWQRTSVLLAVGAGAVHTGAVQTGAVQTGDPFEDLGFGGTVLFEETGTLLEHARGLLDRSRMGLRLYIAGPESFIGRALQVAASFNLSNDEIRAEHAGSAARRVRCVHCRTDMEEVKTNIVRCAGCARWLAVRDHYSRRLAAYMGVMADAEVPGELPVLREVHP